MLSFFRRLFGKRREIEEASAAAVQLGIKTVREYKKRYKEDLRLPSSPQQIYESEWTGWVDFLKK